MLLKKGGEVTEADVGEMGAIGFKRRGFLECLGRGDVKWRGGDGHSDHHVMPITGALEGQLEQNQDRIHQCLRPRADFFSAC